MKMKTKTTLAALGSGILFGIGLLVSGMTDPHRVRAFLDFTGAWNPSLAGVMAGAIAVHGTSLWRERRRLGITVGAPSRVDRYLVAGAAIFGVGWGLGGYCPGPAIVSLGFASGQAWVFFATMVVGVLIGEAIGARRGSGDPSASDAGAPAC